VTGPGPDRSVVFQQFALFPWKTVTENIDFGLRSIGVAGAERARRIAHYIELMNLQGYESAFRTSFREACSSAWRSREATSSTPAVLLMDEPFGALDAQTRTVMQESSSSCRESIRAPCCSSPTPSRKRCILPIAWS
jgi:NitT/TauT family transport system ATP-binding protein